MSRNTADVDLTAPAHQVRALRVRIPVPCDTRWLESQVIAAAEAGFNTLALDVFTRGLSCFPSATAKEFGLPRLHSIFRRRDYLELACTAAQSEGIRVIAVLDSLNQGSRSDYPQSPLLRRILRPWHVAGPPGTFGHQRCSGPDLLLCPANPDLRDFMATFSSEVADGYPIEAVVLCGLQFGPAEGPNAGKCFCAHCTKRHRPDSGDEPWDSYRLKQVSQFVSAIKARTRQGRRSLRIWGELPVLPGSDTAAELVDSEFDRELLDVCLVPPLAENWHPATGVDICEFDAKDEQTLNRLSESATGQTPLGFFCRWSSPELIELESVHLPLAPESPPADQEPVSAARYWLEIAARDCDGRAGKHARECLALWDSNKDPDGPPLEGMHAILEAALPDEDDLQPTCETSVIDRAFALLRLAILLGG